MPSVIFTPDARQDLIDAHTWYEKELPGLGKRFIMALDERINDISVHPHHYAEVLSNIRRARLKRFPYLLYFREYEGNIHIIACLHSSRNPLMWQKRL